MKLQNVFLITALAVTLHAQAHFDVATIKLSGAIDGEHCMDGPAPGRITMKCITLHDVIQAAYGIFANPAAPIVNNLKPLQIVGGPGWINSDHYDFEAKASGNPPLEIMAGPMTQALLEDRFKLKVHRETREQPVYSLTVAKSGLKIQPTKETCAPRDLTAMMTPPAPGQPAPIFCGTMRRPTFKGQNMTMGFRAMTMEDFSAFLSSSLDRTVLNKTGIAGMYDITLEFAIDDTTRKFPGAAFAATQPATDPGPSIFTAIQELGLRLESDKGPVEFLVIDHVEKPSGN
jgi:uncharacterized protein (TIGR03435 family)